MISVWRHSPVVVRAVLVGAAAATAGTLPWGLLAAANLKFVPSVPWAVPVMALYLWILWRSVPRASLRANRLSDDVWAAALVAGTLGLWAVVLLLGVLNRMVRLPAQRTDDLSHVPIVTVIVMLAMSAVVAGVVEETSFRGYMQGPIERRHGPVVAILVTGTVFGFAHFTHPEVTLILMPYYLAVAAVYGTLAYLTNSTLPSMVLHAVGNVFGFVDLLARGRAEWQTAASPEPLVWETGTDASFWIGVAMALIVAAAAVWAYGALARVARPEQQLANSRVGELVN
jgi:membrane protease YdiL (CAAX protease family)